MSFRTRMLLTLTLVLTLSFGAGGTMLLASSFSAALAEEEAGAITRWCAGCWPSCAR